MDGINTLDQLDFEDNVVSSAEPDTQPANNPSKESDTNNPSQESDAITQYLEVIGIKDPEKIKFEDDKGEVTEKSWKDLTEEEKLNILKTPNVKYKDVSDASTYGLDDSETQFINYLRENNLSPDEYINKVKKEASTEVQIPIYKVDSLSDDELFLADLQLRAKDITDEELQQQLEQVKSNPDTYKKYIQGLREEYQNLEKQQQEQEVAEQEAEKQEQFNQFSNSILQSIDSLNSIGDLDITMDKDEKTELANFILGNDGAGVNYLTKALNDPDTLVAASWFLLNGQQAFSEIQDYISNAIKNAKEEGRKQALEEFSSKKEPPKVVVKQPPMQFNPNNKKETSIDDIIFD